MKLLTIIIGLLLLPAMAYYQKSVEISGMVIDSVEKTPLMDCHVYVKGTNIGTVTDEAGMFSLKVPLIYKQRPLIVSYVGFVKYEEKVAVIKKSGVQISLQPDVIALEEIVISPGKELLIDQAIDRVMISYEDKGEMLTDFYLALFALDKDYKVLLEIYPDTKQN